MVNKAYIVVNKEQEQKIISNLYNKRSMWPRSPDRKGNYWSPVHGYIEFPYVITDNGERLNWTNIEMLTNEEIVYDGRKENNMDKKIKIDEKTYKSLAEWRDSCKLKFITSIDMFQLPKAIDDWLEDVNTLFENRKRFTAIIEWLSGKDVFEIEKPKKWVVQSKDRDSDIYKFAYVIVKQSGTMVTTYRLEYATKFNTKEEAQSWANAHQEVIEVEE